jgi:hypothetical protein
MSKRPHLKVILGLTDLDIEDGEILDPRLTCGHPDFETFYLWEALTTVPLPDLPEGAISIYDPKFKHFQRLYAIRSCLTHPGGVARPWSEVFHWNVEICPEVCGWVMSNVPCSDPLGYALALLHPEYAAPGGYQVLPSSQDTRAPDPEGRSLLAVRRLLETDPGNVFRTLRDWPRCAETPQEQRERTTTIKEAARKNRLIRWGLNVPWWADQANLDLAVARWVFRQAGFSIALRDLKLMFYWQWL